jgi:MinD-like ATPase involved in chromosome partitioning or flagellar assembly
LEGRRAPQGLAAEDRLALGLTASHLSYLVTCSLAGYALLASALPGVLKYPVGLLVIGIGALLAWGRLGQRPLDRWVWLAIRFYLRPRRSTAAGPEGGGLLRADDIGQRSSPAARPEPAVKRAELPWEPAERAAESAEVPAEKPELAAERADDAESADNTEEADTTVDPRPDGEPPTAGEDERRILTLPSPFSRVADGTTEYRVERAPEPDPDPAPAASAPVFLAATQRIAFFSLKGGVGKTTLATEVAAYLARTGRYRSRPDATSEPLRVALLDLDLGSANVSMKLGITHPTLWDLVLDPEPDAARLEECLVWHQESGLRVLLGPPRAIAAGEARALAMQRLAQVLSHLDEEGYHFVFLDLSSEVDELTTYALEAAHQVYYVITPTASGVQDTYRGVETLRRLGHRRKLRFVLNQGRAAFDADEMMADLGGRLSASVPQDDAFAKAEDEHEPLSLGKQSPAAASIVALAASIYPSLEETSTKSGFWARLRSRLG